MRRLTGLTLQADLEIVFLRLEAIFSSHRCSKQATLIHENPPHPQGTRQTTQTPDRAPEGVALSGTAAHRLRRHVKAATRSGASRTGLTGRPP